MREDDSTFQEMGNRLGINASTAQRNFKKLSKNCNTHEPTHHSDHPCILSASDHQFCAQKIHSGLAQIAADLRCDYFPRPASTQCIKTSQKVFLVDECTRSFFLRPIHHKKHRAWAVAYENWTLENWNVDIYLDKSKFNLCGSDGIQWCCRGPGEELDEWNVRQEIKHGGQVCDGIGMHDLT